MVRKNLLFAERIGIFFERERPVPGKSFRFLCHFLIDCTSADRLREEINRDPYHRCEEEVRCYWNRILKILEGHLAAFLEAQFQMYRSTKTKQ